MTDVQFNDKTQAKLLLDATVLPEVEDVLSTAETADPKPAEEDEVIRSENSEDTLPLEEPHVPEPAPVSSNNVIEVLVDAEPVVARPLPDLAAAEHVDSVVEGEPVVNSIEDIVSEGLIDEADVLITQPEEVKEPTVAGAVEASEPSPGVVEQGVPIPIPSEPAVEPANEEPVLNVSESDVIAGTVPHVEPGSMVEPQETETWNPPVTSEEEATVDKVGLEQAPSAISEPWTPSYSVSSQGGGLEDALSADGEITEPTVAPELSVEEPAAPTAETGTPAEVCALRVRSLCGGLTRFSLRSQLLSSQRCPPMTRKNPFH